MAIPCRPSIIAKQWLSARPQPLAILLGQPPVEARYSGEGRGQGLFTTGLIPAHTEILREAPIILLEPADDLPQLYEQFISLREPGSKQRYLALSYHEVPERDIRLRSKLQERGFDEASIEEMVKVASVMQTNAFNVDLNRGKGRNHRALFTQIARINHSCAPNAHVCFYPPPPSSSSGKGTMVIHAIRDLQPSEEVLIAYFNILLPHSERQTKAQKWGFTCACSACCEQSGGLHERLRKSIMEFTTRQTTLMQSRPPPSVKQVADVIKTGISIVENTKPIPGLHPTIPDIYENLGMLRAKALLLQKRETHREGVVESLELAAIWEAKLTGKESPATKKRLKKLEQFAGVANGCARIEETTTRGEYVVELVKKT